MMIPVSSPPADNRILTTWFPNTTQIEMGCSNCGIMKILVNIQVNVWCHHCGDLLVQFPKGTVFTWCDRRVV
jgi:ribosomal protein S27E